MKWPTYLPVLRLLMWFKGLLSARDGRRNKEKRDQLQCTTALESLPAELRIEVLKSIPEFCTLRCLLVASPTYYRTYTSFQQEILITIVSRQFIQGTAADVVAALISVDFFHAYDTRTKEEAIAFLDRYRHARGRMSPNALLAPSAEKGIRLTMKDLHNFQACVEVLMDEYLSDIGKSNLSRELYRDETGKISLSSLQQMRIVRAICRIQIYAHVFYQPRSHPVPPAPNLSEYFQLEEAYHLFCATFPPWERNEMWAIYAWFEDRTERTLNTLTNPAIDTPRIALDPHYEHYVFRRMCSRGPMFLGRLFLENDLKKRHDIVYDNFMTFMPWTYSEPEFDDCLLLSPSPELLYPADQLVELYRQDIGDRASLSQLQMPTPGWQEYSYDVHDDFVQLCLRFFEIGAV